MLTIVVGYPENFSGGVDWSDMADEFLPYRLVEEFDYMYRNSRLKTIRVMTDTIINFIGAKIEEGEYDFEDFCIITAFGKHYYESDGMLTRGDQWPFGIFSWDFKG